MVNRPDDWAPPTLETNRMVIADACQDIAVKAAGHWQHLPDISRTPGGAVRRDRANIIVVWGRVDQDAPRARFRQEVAQMHKGAGEIPLDFGKKYG